MNIYKLERHNGFNTFKQSDNLLYQFINDFITNDDEHYSFHSFSKSIQNFGEDIVKEGYDHNMINKSPAEIAAKIKGDVFEIFTMFTMQYFHVMPNIMGIKEGTFSQIPDDEDTGVDFTGTVEFNNKKAYGQIKFRNPFNNNINDKSPDTAFSRSTIAKLYGSAGIDFHFNENFDYLILVTNLDADKALYYKAKEQIGYINGRADLEHDYIKIIDKSIFDSCIQINNIAFWNSFLNTVGK